MSEAKLVATVFGTITILALILSVATRHAEPILGALVADIIAALVVVFVRRVTR